MANTEDLFGSIRTTLEQGEVTLAELGEGPSEVLGLDQPRSMERYARILRPQIQLALKRNKRDQNLLMVLLIVFFVTALGLAVYDRIAGCGTGGKLLLVPGLGVAAVWPVQRLITMNRRALALEVFPSMLPILDRKQAAKLAGQFCTEGLK